MITIKNWSKCYRKVTALSNIQLKFRKAKISIIAGADGAGKTTLFKIMMGLEQRDSGEYQVDGRWITTDLSSILYKFGYMPEKFSLYPDLTVNENLDFFSDIRDVPLKKRDSLKSTLLEITGMSPFITRKAGNLSGGMKQKLALMAILLSSPEIIVLDEPTTGVDPLSRIEFFQILETLKDDGKTILLSTPYLDEAEKGDDIFFMKTGRLIKSGEINDLKKKVPFKIFNLLPKTDPYRVKQEIDPQLNAKWSPFIKGKYIKLVSPDPDLFPDQFTRFGTVTETRPTLEDIYLYYDRTEKGGSGND